MTFHTYDQPHSQFGDYKKINDHYKKEISLVRMDGDYSLNRDDDGSLCFEKEMTRWKDDESIVVSEKVITYMSDGYILIDIPENKTGYSSMHAYRRDFETILGYLPQSVGMYETASNHKKYLLYDPDCNVRVSSYSPLTVWDMTKSKHLKLKPGGGVVGAKKVDRGDKKFSDNKPLDKQLEEKHYREMTKARLKSDLEIDYTKQYATFRGCNTGTSHYCLEMYRPSEHGRSGTTPNSGLIRRLFIGRFMNGKDDAIECKKLVIEILKDIPDSCLTDKLKGIRGEAN